MQLYYSSARAMGEVMAELAGGTGGTWFHDNNDLDEGFRRTADSPEVVYVLGFSPANLKFDGTYHSLKVSLKAGRQVTVQARRGYYDLKPRAMAPDDGMAGLRAALFSREESSDIPLEIETRISPAAARRAHRPIWCATRRSSVPCAATANGALPAAGAAPPCG